MTMRDDLLAFANAISEAFPNDVPRDRFGRFQPGQGNGEPLRLLAVELKIGQSFDRMEQAGRVARALLKRAAAHGLSGE